MDSAIFENQTALMLESIPIVFKSKAFALKGGTAINFFIRDMPRLSVDIDLTYLPLNERSEALIDIERELTLISEEIRNNIPDSEVTECKNNANQVHKLFVSKGDAKIKIEPNPVVRSTVRDIIYRDLSEKAQEKFETYCNIPTLSFDDLYGGKICAALDRQHPRDLFDIKYLLEKEGLTETLRKTFIAYLLSHPRPIHELITPNELDISELFEKEFSGMVTEEVEISELTEARSQLIKQLNNGFSLNERNFIYSFQNCEPNWDLFEYEIKNLPSVRWKLLNLEKLKTNNLKKHSELSNNLKSKLNL